jgi:hypothetical protein
VGQLSNANAMTVASVAARLLAKAAAFLDQPAGKNFHTILGDEPKVGIVRFHTPLDQAKT